MECTICYEAFDHSSRKPVIGLCGHTLCLKCCNSIMRNEPHTCPHCNQQDSYKNKTINYQVLGAVTDVPIQSIDEILKRPDMIRHTKYLVDLTKWNYVLHNCFRMEIALEGNNNILKLTILLPLITETIKISGNWRIDCKLVLSKDDTLNEARQTFNWMQPTCEIDLPSGIDWTLFKLYMDAECQGLGLEPRIDYSVKTDLTDFRIIVKGHAFYVSKAIMAQKSKYFARLFASDRTISKLALENESYNAFREFLDVIHGFGLVHGIKKAETSRLLDLGARYQAEIVRITVENFFLGQGSSCASWEDKLELAEQYGLARLMSYASAKKTY